MYFTSQKFLYSYFFFLCTFLLILFLILFDSQLTMYFSCVLHHFFLVKEVLQTTPNSTLSEISTLILCLYRCLKRSTSSVGGLHHLQIGHECVCPHFTVDLLQKTSSDQSLRCLPELLHYEPNSPFSYFLPLIH